MWSASRHARGSVHAPGRPGSDRAIDLSRGPGRLHPAWSSTFQFDVGQERGLHKVHAREGLRTPWWSRADPPPGVLMRRDLLTIGYEGCTIDQVLAELKAAGVELLIDVRAVPMSRKPGFSKRQLAAGLDEQGIA